MRLDDPNSDPQSPDERLAGSGSSLVTSELRMQRQDPRIRVAGEAGLPL